MKKAIKFIFLLLFFYGKMLSQLKLNEIPHDLSTINKRDVNGWKKGIWFFYDKKDSTVFAMQTFSNDTLNGYFERYWYNGKISELGFYRNGKLDSVFIAYWEDGNKRGEARYINGVLNGIVTSYSKEGMLTSRLKYIHGKTDEFFKEEFIDSNLVWDNERRDKIDTIKVVFNSEWNKKYAIYRNDTMVKEMDFYKNTVVIESFYDNMVLCKRIIYHKRKPFRIKKIFHYNNGQPFKVDYYNKRFFSQKIIIQTKPYVAPSIKNWEMGTDGN